MKLRHILSHKVRDIVTQTFNQVIIEIIRILVKKLLDALAMPRSNVRKTKVIPCVVHFVYVHSVMPSMATWMLMHILT